MPRWRRVLALACRRARIASAYRGAADLDLKRRDRHPLPNRDLDEAQRMPGSYGFPRTAIITNRLMGAKEEDARDGERPCRDQSCGRQDDHGEGDGFTDPLVPGVAEDS
jgi:hypothetical protein